MIETEQKPEIQVWNFGGANLTLHFAERILSELSKTGSITVVGIAPGSFSLVAMLQDLVEMNRDREKEATHG